MLNGLECPVFRCPSPLIPLPRGLKALMEKFMSLLLLPELEARRLAEYPGLSESLLMAVLIITSVNV